MVDGLRGLAILAVLYHHLASQFYTPFALMRRFPVGRLQVAPAALVANGWLGVNLFFVLSGFVLALPYARGVRDLRSPRDALTFYARRALRLLPLYYLCVAACLLANTRMDPGAPQTLRDLVAYATCTFVYDPRLFIPRWNPSLWSLGVEVSFSVLVPLLVVVRRRASLLVTVAVLVLAYAVRSWDAARWSGHAAYQLMVKDGVLGRLDDFVVGMWLAELHARGRRLSPGWSGVAVVGGVALLWASAVGWDNVVLGNVAYGVSPVLNDVTLAGAALVLAGALGAPAWLRVPLTFPPLRVAGMMCYSLYVWHLVGIAQVSGKGWQPDDLPPYLGLVLVASVLTYRYVEFPGRSLRELFIPARPHPVEPGTLATPAATADGSRESLAARAGRAV